jgi:hypothetical protein
LTDDEKSKNNGTHCVATVYSFFHRELAPMAKDVIQLLSKTSAWVDPNLIALLPRDEKGTVEEGGSRRKRRKRGKAALDKTKINEEAKQQGADSNEDGLRSDDEFASLAHNRIVLQRASNVSDEDSD